MRHEFAVHAVACPSLRVFCFVSLSHYSCNSWPLSLCYHETLASSKASGFPSKSYRKPWALFLTSSPLEETDCTEAKYLPPLSCRVLHFSIDFSDAPFPSQGKGCCRPAVQLSPHSTSSLLFPHKQDTPHLGPI